MDEKRLRKAIEQLLEVQPDPQRLRDHLEGLCRDPLFSGLMGAHVGANVRYRINPNFGVFASPEIDIQFPSFMFNLDLTVAGVEAAF